MVLCVGDELQYTQRRVEIQTKNRLNAKMNSKGFVSHLAMQHLGGADYD